MSNCPDPQNQGLLQFKYPQSLDFCPWHFSALDSSENICLPPTHKLPTAVLMFTLEVRTNSAYKLTHTPQWPKLLMCKSNVGLEPKGSLGAGDG